VILPAIRVQLRQGPVDAAQLSAWRKLWAVLLSDPEHANAIEEALQGRHRGQSRAVPEDLVCERS
jgi:hypothetical protein